MMFLLLLLPMTLFGGVLAWMSWRARNRRTALALVGVSLACAVLSAGILLGCHFLYQALLPCLAG